MSHPPVVLVVGGLDPTGAAGLAADLRAGAALGALVAPVASALTVQDAGGVQRVEAVDPQLLKQQVAAALRSLPVGAVKVGLLPGRAQAQALAEALPAGGPPLVLDPVLSATPGGALAGAEVPGALRELLFRRAALLTPNLDEAAALLGREPGREQAGLEAAARELRALGPGAVLLKGGHLPGPLAADYLADETGGLWLQSARLDTPNTRGTGCSLASLLAVLLARGQPLRAAAIGAKDALRILLLRGAASAWPQGRPGPLGL